MPRAATVPAPAAHAAIDQLVDAEDAGIEMIDALRELSSHQNPESQAMLDQLEALPPAQMKAAVAALLEQLDDAQRGELVATSEEEDEAPGA